MFESLPVTLISATSAVVAIFTTYYYSWVSQKPKVFGSSQKLMKFLDSHVKTLKEKFYPSPILCEGRLQTILGLRQRITYPRKLPYEREILPLSDGGEIALDYAKVDSECERPFWVLFLPGLTSSSQTSYVRTMVQKFNEVGASVVVFNNRGNGGVPFKTAKTYSASFIGDLEEVIAHLKKKFPADARIIGLGTSMGGMVLAKYLVTKPLEAKRNFECAILISIIWDCVRGSENLEKPFINKYLINKALAGGLVRLGKQFINNFQNVDFKFYPKQALEAKTVREFDAAFTAPQYGFENVVEYYKDATTCGNVHKFSIPVFGLSAEDDPIQPGILLPRDEAMAKDSKLALIVTTRGGHLGWVEGFTRRPDHYMERVIGELIEAIRKHGTEEISNLSNGTSAY